MTEREIELAGSLAKCSLPTGTSKKRFARQMIDLARVAPDQPIAPAQSLYLEQLRHYFRKQMPRPCDCSSCTKQLSLSKGNSHEHCQQ